MKKTFVLILLAGLLAPNLTQAFAYNKNYIISDSDLINHRSMTLERIDEFINHRGGGLAGMSFEAIGGLKSAAQIIYDACSYYRLNPKYLLVRLQMEQSLITDPTLSQSQIDWAAGYGCPDGQGCSSSYKGFFNQVNHSLKGIRGDKYLAGLEANGTTISGWGPGITKTTLDGISVTPQNDATAVLYTYTPWVGKWGGGDQRWGGNSLFAKTWYEWFLKRYPDGTLLREDGQSGIWLLQNGKKRPFHSRSAFFASYDPSKVITVSGVELDAYETGLPIKYANYSLIQSPRGTVFLIVNGEKRGIESSEVFRTIGFNPEEIIQTSWEDVNSFADGETITLDSIYPTGTLLQSLETGGIFYVEDGIKHSIWSREILQSRFPNQKWSTVTEEELSLFEDGDPVKFKDGELVTSAGTKSIFVISNGERRPIASRDVFDSLGYNWQHLIWTSDQALLRAHSLGLPIDIE
ncbi:MAG: hypothetical protein ABIB97_01455 [Patescibacteria group bacterium]